jgi:hypothetical protein
MIDIVKRSDLTKRLILLTNNDLTNDKYNSKNNK